MPGGRSRGKLVAMSFRRTWSRFVARPRVLVPSPGVREAWHQGRRWYHVWVLRVVDPVIRARRDAVRAALGDWVIPFCEEDLHVTIWVHGFAPPPTHPLEGRELELRIGRVNAFASCPFFEVRGPMAPLRAAFVGPEERWSAWRPHLTVARFVQPVRPAEVARRLRPFRSLPELPVKAIFAHRVLDAFDEGGRLHPPERAGADAAGSRKTPASETKLVTSAPGVRSKAGL